MSSSNVTTAKFNVDISDLKKNIQDASRQIRLANAEFKAASSGMADWSKSTDGVSAKISQLDKNLKNQNAILDSYKKQLELIVAEQGEESKGADEMRIKIANQQAVVNKTAAELDKYKGVLDNLEREQEESAKSAEKQASAYDQLKATIEKQETDLDDLKKQYAAVVLEEGKNSESAKDLASQIDALSKELKDNKTKMEEADKAAESLDKSVDNAGKDAKDSTDGFTVLKGALADLASTAIQAVIQGLKDMASAAADAWAEFDDGRDTLLKLTGATGESADDLMASYKNVAKSVNGSFKDIGSAIGEVSTRFGITGDKLDDIATRFVKFSDVTGSDIVSSVDNVQKALGAFGMGADDAGYFLDKLTQTSQATGVSVDTLTRGLVSNGTAFQQMGLSIDQSIEFMGMLEKSGANSETVLNGMRKALKNSATDGMSLATALVALQGEIENGANGVDGLTASYDLFGKSGDQIYGAIKAGTLSFKDLAKVASEAGGTLETTFENTQSPIDKLNLAIQGIRFEVADTIERILREHKPQVDKAIDTLTEKALPVIIKLLEGIADVVGFLIDNGETIVGILEAMGVAVAVYVGYSTALKVMTDGFMALSIAEKAAAAAQTILNVAMTANPIGLIIAAIAALVAAFIYLWNNSEDFRNFFIGMWNKIKDVVLEAWDFITGVFKDAWKTITDIWAGLVLFFTGIFDGIKETWSKVSDWFKNNVTEPVKDDFNKMCDGIEKDVKNSWEAQKRIMYGSAKWYDDNVVKPIKKQFDKFYDGLPQGAKDAWSGIQKVFGTVGEWFARVFKNAWEKIKDVFSDSGTFFTNIKDAVTDGIKSTANKVIEGLNKVIRLPFDTINKVLEKLASLSIGGKAPLSDLTKWKVNVPQIPLLASGGVLARGQMGLLEGTGAEAVVPLENNKRWIAATARELKSALVSEGIISAGTVGAAGKAVINNYTFTQNNTSPKALDRLDIYRETNSLLFNARVRVSNV